MALRFTRSSSRVAVAVAALIVVAVVAAAVLLAGDPALVTRALAAVDHSPAQSKSCTAPCRGGRMLVL